MTKYPIQLPLGADAIPNGTDAPSSGSPFQAPKLDIPIDHTLWIPVRPGTIPSELDAIMSCSCTLSEMMNKTNVAITVRVAQRQSSWLKGFGSLEIRLVLGIPPLVHSDPNGACKPLCELSTTFVALYFPILQGLKDMDDRNGAPCRRWSFL